MAEGQRKRRRGPAPFEPQRLRSKRLSVYVTDAELAELEQRAARLGIQASAYLREAGLRRLAKPIPELNREAWAQLARSASNLNQVAYRLNLGEVLDLGEVRRMLEEFRNGLINAKTPSEEKADESED